MRLQRAEAVAAGGHCPLDGFSHLKSGSRDPGPGWADRAEAVQGRLWESGRCKFLPAPGNWLQEGPCRHQQGGESVSGCLSCPPGPVSAEPGVRQNLLQALSGP